MALNTDIRWRQRLENLERAVSLLQTALADGASKLSPLEREGTIHRFEMAFELAWKTLKDYLEHQGTFVKPAAPRAVIKEAHSAGILPNGLLWIEMLDHRNLVAHNYDLETFEIAVVAIEQRYLPAFVTLRDWLKTQP